VQVGGGVVVDDHPDVSVALDVLVHRRDAGGFAGDEDVLRVGVAPRPQPDPAAPGHPDPVHQHRIDLGANRVVGQRIPPVDSLGHLGDEAGRPVRIPQHAVQARHGLGRHVVTLVDDPGGPRIGGPRLRLLLVGHRHHAQGQNLVDLGAVIQRGIALLGDLGVVVEDDR
jgi:hypothetical protein